MEPAPGRPPPATRPAAGGEREGEGASGPALARAFQALEALLGEARVPASHGLEHAQAVHRHVAAALSRDSHLSAAQKLALEAAAALHDADDSKYFSSSVSLANARAILAQALRGHPQAGPVTALALEAIALVSVSKNGNSVPPRAKAFPQLLYPRWADRLEQIGWVGVARTCQFSEEGGRPLLADGTPLPATAEEARALATPARFRAYVQRGGGSASTVDHFYDKLLHLPEPLAASGHWYFADRARAGQAPLLAACVAAGDPRAFAACRRRAEKETAAWGTSSPSAAKTDSGGAGGLRPPRGTPAP